MTHVARIRALPIIVPSHTSEARQICAIRSMSSSSASRNPSRTRTCIFGDHCSALNRLKTAVPSIPHRVRILKCVSLRPGLKLFSDASHIHIQRAGMSSGSKWSR